MTTEPGLKRDSHVSSRGLEDGAAGRVQDQDGGLLDGTQEPLLVSGLTVKRAAEENPAMRTQGASEI